MATSREVLDELQNRPTWALKQLLVTNLNASTELSVGEKVRVSNTAQHTLTISNGLGVEIFRVDQDGTIHIPTGTSVLADL